MWLTDFRCLVIIWVGLIGASGTAPVAVLAAVFIAVYVHRGIRGGA